MEGLGTMLRSSVVMDDDCERGMGPSPMVDLRAQTRPIGSRERRQLSKRDARTRLRATLDPRGRTSGNASLERLLPPCAVATRLDLEPGRGRGDERKTDAVK